MKRELLINISDYETRVALLEEDRLVEMVVERPDTERMIGDIYKGRINRVLPGLQAAFIEIGWEKAAFLHSSDMGSVREGQERFEAEPDSDDNAVEIVRKKRFTAIESVLTEGQDILVQVIKEPIGSKGPRVSTDISIPGRYLVLVPDSDRILVSRKVSDWGERKRLRKIVSGIRPEGFGLICRTESEGKEEKDFLLDIKRLLKMWRLLQRSAERGEAPFLIHKEEKLTTSVVRDIFNDSIDRCLVDDRREYRRLTAYARQVAPHLKNRIELYKGDKPLFDLYDLETEIEKMLERKVWIKKGSYLVIDQTEAMITIDVNTGRFVGKKDQERTIFLTNIEAAREIARQLRLRDMGGLIVCDFIDMYSRENRRLLYEEFKRALDKDRAKKAVNPVTEFGLIELTRERIRPSLVQTLSEPCTCCNGFGRVLSRESMSAKIDRWFLRAKAAGKYDQYHLIVSPGLAEMMAAPSGDIRDTRIRRIMKRCSVKVNLVRDTTISAQEFRVYDANTNTDVTMVYE